MGIFSWLLPTGRDHETSMFDKGYRQGFQDGRKKGVAEGIAQGRKTGWKEAVSTVGNMVDELIIKKD